MRNQEIWKELSEKIKERIKYTHFRWKHTYQHYLLKCLNFDRKEETWEEIIEKIKKGDEDLIFKLFQWAPSVDWLIWILGKDFAEELWQKYKLRLSPSEDPFSLYRQCEIFLEEQNYSTWKREE